MPKATKPHFTEALVNGVGLITASWGRSFEELYKRIGAGRLYSLGGHLALDVTTVGTVGVGVDDLITYSLQANTLLNTGDRIDVLAFGTFANNSNNKELKLVFGTTEIFTTTVKKPQNTSWRINCTIIRITATTQKITATYLGEALAGAVNAIYTAGTEDLTTALTIKCTGEATSNNDIVQEGLIINMFPV